MLQMSCSFLFPPSWVETRPFWYFFGFRIFTKFHRPIAYRFPGYPHRLRNLFLGMAGLPS
jgi:hypothetical protein